MSEPSFRDSSFPKYRMPLGPVLRVALFALSGRQRSFREDAQTLVAGIQPALEVAGCEHIPQDHAFIITINHYSRPGFGAWWLALAVSAVLEKDIHWMMTGAWTFPERWYAGLLSPLSRWLFTRLAQVYGFTTTPPVPSDLHEAQSHAHETQVRTHKAYAGGESVRRVLDAARHNPRSVIGLSPEGRDFPGGALGWPPPGVGRFIYQLNRMGYAILPVGLYEEDGRFCVKFGAAYHLGEPHSHSSGEVHPETRRLVAQRQIDLLLARTIMLRIAVLLPERLRGDFD